MIEKEIKTLCHYVFYAVSCIDGLNWKCASCGRFAVGVFVCILWENIVFWIHSCVFRNMKFCLSTCQKIRKRKCLEFWTLHHKETERIKVKWKDKNFTWDTDLHKQISNIQTWIYFRLSLCLFHVDLRHYSCFIPRFEGSVHVQWMLKSILNSQ